MKRLNRRKLILITITFLGVAALLHYSVPERMAGWKRSDWHDWLETASFVAVIIAALPVIIGPVWAFMHPARSSESQSHELSTSNLSAMTGTASVNLIPSSLTMSRADPLILGVHQAISLDTAKSLLGSNDPPIKSRRGPRFWLDRRHKDLAISADLPLYVRRGYDSNIGEWLRKHASRQGGFLLVIGRPSVGKTRLVYEALAEELGNWSLYRPVDAEELDRNAKSIMATGKSIIWLDELQQHLMGPWLQPGRVPVNGATVGRLLTNPAPVLIVGTLWPDRYAEFTAIDKDPVSNRKDLRHPAAYEVLRMVTKEVRLPDRPFDTPIERQKLDRAATIDLRLAVAKDRSYGVTQTLAGGDALVRRWETSPPFEQAVLDAAIDLRRLGARQLITESTLCAATQAYLKPKESNEFSCGQALSTLAESNPFDAGTSPLVLIDDKQGAGFLGYEVADYLLDYGERMRSGKPIPERLWPVIERHLQSPFDVLQCGLGAMHRCRPAAAKTLLRKAAQLGAPGANIQLASFLAGEEGPGHISFRPKLPLAPESIEEAKNAVRTALILKEPGAMVHGSFLLAGMGFIDDARKILRDAIADGDPAELTNTITISMIMPQEELVVLLETAVASGKTGRRWMLAWVLRNLKRNQEAEQVLRDGINSGEELRLFLVTFLMDRGAPDAEIRSVLQQALAAGEGGARETLAEFSYKTGHTKEAITLIMESLASGESEEKISLYEMLEKFTSSHWRFYFKRRRVRKDLVKMLYRQLYSVDSTSIMRDKLVSLNGIDKVESALRQAIAQGAPNARTLLSGLLWELGRLAEAEQFAKEAVIAGEPEARSNLATFLHLRGRREEYDNLLRTGLSADSAN